MRESRGKRIKNLLLEQFSAASIVLVDESAKHAGHAGAQPEGESHYDLTIISEVFNGLSRIERHRRITHALKDEFETGLHALRIKALTPHESP